MINKEWFKSIKISCSIIKEDTSYQKTENKHIITVVTQLDNNKILKDLLEKLKYNVK